MRRILILLLLLCFVLPIGVSAANAEVSSLETNITVNQDGSCKVTMSATIRFVSALKRFTIPLASNADDIHATGGSYEIASYEDVECVVFKSKQGFTGEMTFVCSYTIAQTVEEKGSKQVFQLKLPERGWAFPIDSYSFDITFPAPVEKQPSWYSAYHGVDIENYLDISIGDQRMSVRSFERLKDQETITMELDFAPDSFDLSHMPGQTVSVAKVLFWLLCAAALVYRYLRLRRGRLQPSVRQTVMNESTAGEIPCQLFGAMPDAVGMLAHWGNLGYLTISRNRSGRIVLHKQMEMGSERSAAERKLFYTLFRSSDNLDAIDPRIMNVSKRVGVQIRSSWLRRLFRKNTGSPYLLRLLALGAAAMASLMTFDLMLPANLLRWFLLPVLTVFGAGLAYLVQLACLHFYGRRRMLFLIGGCLSGLLLVIFSMSAGCFTVMLANLALQIYCAVTVMFGGLREASAQDLVRQILGLRTFLRTANAQSLQRLCASDSQYFYRMLPFAEQLGVAAAFTRRCATLRLEPCPWLTDAQSHMRSAAEFYAAYAQIVAAIRKEPTFAQPTRRSSSEVMYG